MAGVWIVAAGQVLYAAARPGICLEGCTYVDLTPRADCVREIIQAGLCEVVVSGRACGPIPAQPIVNNI